MSDISGARERYPSTGGIASATNKESRVISGKDGSPGGVAASETGTPLTD